MPLTSKQRYQIEEIRKRLDAATPGPWKWEEKLDGYYSHLLSEGELGEDDYEYVIGEEDEGIDMPRLEDRNAVLIENAPNDIGVLLEVIDELLGDVEVLKYMPNVYIDPEEHALSIGATPIPYDPEREEIVRETIRLFGEGTISFEEMQRRINENE